MNLDIRRGELFALLGPNGSGKTTTINMLCCLLKPTRGTASVMGFDINREPRSVKTVIGVSPQETTLSEHLSPLENLELIAGLRGISPDRARKWSKAMVEIMGLEERSKDQVRKFSGGMKRRLSIAMALIADPAVVFLDEPTLGLDPQARRALWEYIASLKGEKTILLTTHYMEEADFLSDNIAIIDSGKIAALGTSMDLKTLSMEKRTIVINAWNITIKAIDLIRDKYKEVKINGNSLSISGKYLDFKETTDFIHSTGAIIRSAYFKEPSLEEAYLKITGKELAG
ncbi:MAG: ABC transporter ATP-binding protein [Dehalococcoidales bacterium]|nr:ABC transporter ATP-binding protein [Dehalococcoidales bacterium]MDD3264855.1 ABC transporter ATP-binding protein [Dehalococcoidales bacterium]MDD4322037.1 ABC transporter ATP-binding protein [Dehalococcoidales bacterium]MDD4794414.1 ABC transporter ATP-binding protein [Dehalococcoidales bacterium]MDD5498002.1 ABC transporter ATP-binding protein [Dehalococcoidales bacterium]